MAQSVRFLSMSRGTHSLLEAYRPIDPDGRIYTQNAGHLFVIGN